MLTIKDLQEFAEKLGSGELEREFDRAGENGRHEILELLEKLMDVADLANVVASSIIYRGLKLPETRASRDKLAAGQEEV